MSKGQLESFFVNEGTRRCPLIGSYSWSSSLLNFPVIHPADHGSLSKQVSKSSARDNVNKDGSYRELKHEVCDAFHFSLTMIL